MTVPMKTPVSATAIESVLAQGNLSALTPEQRTEYYFRLCESLGLNPLTRPFEYLMLNGKLVLYARRDAADQLRKIRNISLEIVSRDIADDILTVHVRAKTPQGRTDEDLGAVAFPATLKGEHRANAELKCVTKAKRRTTLSICGLGFLDETEIADIPASAKQPPSFKPDVMYQFGQPTEEEAKKNSAIPPPPKRGPGRPPRVDAPKYQSAPLHDEETGEITSWGDGADAAEINPPKTDPAASVVIPVEELAREAAKKGSAKLDHFWKTLTPEEKEPLRKIGTELRFLASAYDAAESTDDRL